MDKELQWEYRSEYLSHSSVSVWSVTRNRGRPPCVIKTCLAPGQSPEALTPPHYSTLPFKGLPSAVTMTT